MSAKNQTSANPLYSLAVRQIYRATNALNNYYGPVLDVSRYQEPIQWATMWARGVRLVLLRLSVGNYYKDVQFNKFYAQARAAGFLLGAYHVTKPSNTVESQWIQIVNSLEGRLLDIPLIFDNELHDNLSQTQVSNTIAGLTQIHKEVIGNYPVQYLRGYWWNTYTATRPIFGQCPLFIARYTTLAHPWNDWAAFKPRDWETWALWQFSADGNGLGPYYGVGSASVDISRGNAPDLETTLKLLKGEKPIVIGDDMQIHKAVCNLQGLKIRKTPIALPDDSNKIGYMNKGQEFLYLPEFTEKPNATDEWLLVPNPAPGYTKAYVAKEHSTLSGSGVIVSGPWNP